MNIENITFDEFIEIYKEDKRGDLKERTLSLKSDITRKHILPYFTGHTLGSIGPADIQAWKNTIRTLGYSPSYERTIDNQFTAYISHACTFYGLAPNPCRCVRKMGRFRNRVDFLTMEEYQRFLAQCRPGSWEHVIFDTLAFTGMRCGECLALTPEDIDIPGRRISITKTYYRRGGEDFVTTPKTEESFREVAIPAFLAEELSEYMAGRPATARIFSISSEAVGHAMKKRLAGAGIRHLPVHSLRHFFASHLISMGVDPLTVKEMLGHKDIKITLNTYAHLMPNRQREVTDLLDERAGVLNGTLPFAFKSRALENL